MDVSEFDCNGIWKMLDEMAISDPVGYHKFISDHLKQGSNLFSQPRCRGVLKCMLKEGCPIFLNICEWNLIDPPKSKTAPIPFYCGSIYNVNGDKTVCVAMHPVVFEQYNFLKTETEVCSDVNQLIALIILYLRHEKGIYTVESDRITCEISEHQFNTNWCSEPYGGESKMFDSLNYTKFSLANMSKQLMRATESSPSFMEYPDNFKPNINLSLTNSNENTKVVEEVKARPSWQSVKHRRKPNICEYSIILPDGTRLDDCELDISEVRLSQSIMSCQ
ncbi:hypothetical protein Aperf_G00000067670 [Anoplocephala perfoliata]